MPGLFGDMDANDVNDDPFYVAPDVYACVLTELNLVHAKSGRTGISFKWSIDEADSEYNNYSLSEWINVYLSNDDAKDEVSLRRDRARLKSRLISIGMTTEDMNNLLVEVDGETVINEEIADSYIGLTADVTVTETADKNDPDKKYTNVRNVVLTD